MKLSKIKVSMSILLILAIASSSFAQSKQKIDKKQLANQVKSEFLHAWNGYKNMPGDTMI